VFSYTPGSRDSKLPARLVHRGSFCYGFPIVSRELAQPSVLAGLTKAGQTIVREELDLLERVEQRLERDRSILPVQIENLDAQLIELRDAIAEAKEEDIPSLIDQMHQVAALSRKRGQGRSLPIDPKNPYFGHLRVRETKSGRLRDVLIGKHTLLEDGDGVTVVDWRHAPVSRLYYRYDEGDEYEEEFDDRTMEGAVLVRRSIGVQDSELRRVAAPQGTFVFTRQGVWQEAVGSARPTLEGGAGMAIRVPRGHLGVHGDDDAPRADKHLQEITALIDKQQFDLITRPDSGIVLIQGGAGSGKTTVALHRVAYLAFQDAERFHPSRMLVVVFNDALVEYIRHVLPALGVEGVTVTTYRRWSASLISRLKLRMPAHRNESTPEPVSRFKKHPLMMSIVDAHVRRQLDDIETALKERLEQRGGIDVALDVWRRNANLPPLQRTERCIKQIGDQRTPVSPQARTAAETVLRNGRDQLRDVVTDWVEIMSDANTLQQAAIEHAPGDFTASELASIARWCVRQAELDAVTADDDIDSLPEGVGLDDEDDAIVLRLLQCKTGGLFVDNKRFEYEHIVIDEAQDLCALEVRVLLDCVSRGQSVTIAGDRAQKMVFDNGFTDWPKLLSDARLVHVEIQPLKITYRSTRQVMELSRHVLGPLHDPSDDLVARDGANVGYHGFHEVGEAVAFLGEALRGLMQREPSASVALIARYPQQADVYYESLRVAEVPRLRRVRREDFSFVPGIDVTDVRQVKGLEFDYVVILDPTAQNYPEQVESRHLLHIAATRAAFQLWIVCAGMPSKLLPPELVVGSG